MSIESKRKRIASIREKQNRKEFLKQIKIFQNGHWTLEMPCNQGTYLVRARDTEIGAQVIVIYEFEGNLRSTSKWGGWWWSEPWPDLPPTPDCQDV